jgi:Fe-S-cluster containining protein
MRILLRQDYLNFNRWMSLFVTANCLKGCTVDTENKNAKITSEIFSADMTKLIAADSFLSSFDKPDSYDCAIDPYAPQSFEALCTVLTNDTRIYFKRPAYFPERPRPIMATWNKVAKDLVKRGEVTKLLPQENQPILSLEKRCQIMIGPFAEFVSLDETSAKLSQWVRFQLSDRELMNIYWQNSTTEELQTAFHIMHEYCEGIPATLQTAFKNAILPNKIDEHSADRLNGKWAPTPDEYAAAYIFWAFVKGYRYAASLTSQHVYAYHWLREKAMKVDIEFKRLDDEYLRRLFPWG